MKHAVRIPAFLLTAVLLMNLVFSVFALDGGADQALPKEQKGQSNGASVVVTAEAKYYFGWAGTFIGDLCFVEQVEPGYNAIVDYKGNIIWKLKEGEKSAQIYKSGFLSVFSDPTRGQYYNANRTQLSDGKYSYDPQHGVELKDHATGEASWLVADAVSSNGSSAGRALISLKAQTMLAQDFGEIWSGMVTVRENGKWGLRKLYGKLLISCTYDALELIGPNRLIGIKNGNGYILDLNGNTVKALGALSEFKSQERLYDLDRLLVKQGSFWGVMDLQGNLLIPCEYEELWYYNAPNIPENLYYGVKNGVEYSLGEGQNGARIPLGGVNDSDTSYAYVEPFGNNVYVRRDGGEYKYSVLDRTGAALLPGQYDSYVINGNRSHLLLEKQQTNDKGQTVLTYTVYRADMTTVMELNGLTSLNDEGIQNLSGSVVSFYNLEGYLLGTIDNVSFVNGEDSLVVLGRGSSYALADSAGNLFTDFIYQDIMRIEGKEIVAARQGNTWYLLNYNGRKVLNDPLDLYPLFYYGTTYSFFLSNGKYGVCKYVPAAAECSNSDTGKHRWERKSAVTAATCTETGEQCYRCAVCGATKTEITPIDPDNHAWTLTEVLTEAEEGGLHACTGLYTCSRCEEAKEAPLCAAEVFTDMPAEGNWAHAPIDWAYFHGITSGKTAATFAPKDTVTRAEAMTFLWKTVGSPEPNAEENPFTDVAEGKYFYKPVLWAVENGITGGATETTFAPKQKCTRAQIMMFLWAAAGRPEPETTENPFTDVPSNKYYYSAVLWAVENNITGGIAPDKFGPNNTCTRAQIVTFLYKAAPLLTADPQPEPDPEPDPTPDPETP